MVSFQLPSIDIPWPTHMDYAGQGKAEKIFQIIIMVFAGVGFLWGYMCQQVKADGGKGGGGCKANQRHGSTKMNE